MPRSNADGNPFCRLARTDGPQAQTVEPLSYRDFPDCNHPKRENQTVQYGAASVIRGLARFRVVHHLRKNFRKKDGLPGRKRVYARLQRAMPGNDHLGRGLTPCPPSGHIHGPLAQSNRFASIALPAPATIQLSWTRRQSSAEFWPRTASAWFTAAGRSA